MRLVWTAHENASAVRKLLAARGYSEIAVSLPADAEWRLHRRFPLVIDASGAFVSDAFQFFFDMGVIRGSTRSMRTLETYAECLCDWLTFAERTQAPWRRPSTAMLAAYRDQLLGTSISSVHRSRALARRTVNLRITVAIEFYKFLAELPNVDPDVRLVVSRRLPQLRRLRVRVDRRRPRALSDTHCRVLCERLRGVHRLMFQWALCTGLRTSSLVSIQLVAAELAGLDAASAYSNLDSTQVIEIRDRAARFLGEMRSSTDVRRLLSAGVRLVPCDWGMCVYRQETSLCEGTWDAPSVERRSPTVCRKCLNFVATAKHLPFWRRRVGDCLRVLSHQGLPDQTKILVELRLAEAQDVVKKILQGVSK